MLIKIVKKISHKNDERYRVKSEAEVWISFLISTTIYEYSNSCEIFMNW